jgi:hypothetical protein
MVYMRPELARDSRIAALADAQHGVVTRSQLSVLGFSEPTSHGGFERRACTGSIVACTRSAIGC